MSDNELRAGRRPTQLIWPDDQTITAGGDCKSLEMVDVPGQMAPVQMVRAEWDDGSVGMINPLHVAMIMFKD